VCSMCRWSECVGLLIFGANAVVFFSLVCARWVAVGVVGVAVRHSRARGAVESIDMYASENPDRYNGLLRSRVEAARYWKNFNYAHVPCWLDCDPGHDDAFAMYAAGWGNWRDDDGAIVATFELMGVSTVAGNQTIEKTTYNAARVLKWLNLDEIVPLVEGASKPLLREAKVCEEIHGESGLDTRDAIDALPGVSDRDFQNMKQKHAVVAVEIFETWKKLYEMDERLVIVATGPLTNIATFCLTYGQVISQITHGQSHTKGPKIVFMGGAIEKGNTGSRAEFNIQCDPEAAKIVLESSFEVIMVPLEVTHTALVTADVLRRLQNASIVRTYRKRVGQITELLDFFKMTYQRVFGFEHPPLHDPCAVWCALTEHVETLKRDAFTGDVERVDVECQSQLTYGQTVLDCWGTSTKPKNVKVMKRMNVEWFWKFMCAAIREHSEQCESYQYFSKN